MCDALFLELVEIFKHKATRSEKLFCKLLHSLTSSEKKDSCHSKIFIKIFCIKSWQSEYYSEYHDLDHDKHSHCYIRFYFPGKCVKFV